jgi:hypothetical protein
MSEFQYVGFRAIDAPVSEHNLEFMEKQSSRAEITPWSFDNEYHYGDFRGDAPEMLRRGYDFHLYYANFGTRTLAIRLPGGLPSPEVSKKYLMKDGISFQKDKQGRAGTLFVEPYLEPGVLDDIWDPGPVLDRLLPLRAELIGGDLRPLYIAYLALACDSNHDPDEVSEPPVPAGLGNLTKAQRELVRFYGIDEALLATAAKLSPPLPARADPMKHYVAWLRTQTAATKNGWLAHLMADPKAPVRRDMMAQFAETQKPSSWPTVESHRTVAELLKAAGLADQPDVEQESRKTRS